MEPDFTLFIGTLHHAVCVGPGREPEPSLTGLPVLLEVLLPRDPQPDLDGCGPPAGSPAFSFWGLGKTESLLPVKLELSFGAPIPSTADSDGRQRKRRERVHNWH